MIVVLRTPDGKKVICNTEKDELLYNAPKNPPNTGTHYTRGADLYTHISRSGKRYFYLKDWSMWQNEETTYRLITANEAKDFLLDKMDGGYYTTLDDAEIERAKQLFPDLLDEDA